MARNREPYTLYKRKLASGKNVWYFYTYDEYGKRHSRSTGETKKALAKDFVLNWFKLNQYAASEIRIKQLQNEKINEIMDSYSINGIDVKDKIIKWINIEWKNFDNREQLAVLFTLFEGKCYYCKRKVHLKGREGPKKNRAVIDHYIPIIGGGSDNVNNLVLSCHECNNKKSDMRPEKFIEILLRKR